MDAPERQSSIRKRRSVGVRLQRWIVPRLLFVASYPSSARVASPTSTSTTRTSFLDRRLPILFAGLHEGLLYLPYHFRDRDGVVMVSASRDGDLIADTMALFGLRAARGSSTRGGRAALDAMASEIKATGCSGGIIVDGPRGPALVAKMGAITLGAATGLPVVPGAWWASRVVRLRSWDATIIPLPFSRMVVAFEPALECRPTRQPAAMETFRRELTARLGRARARARAAAERSAQPDEPPG